MSPTMEGARCLALFHALKRGAKDEKSDMLRCAVRLMEGSLQHDEGAHLPRPAEESVAPQRKRKSQESSGGAIADLVASVREMASQAKRPRLEDMGALFESIRSARRLQEELQEDNAAEDNPLMQMTVKRISRLVKALEENDESG